MLGSIDVTTATGLELGPLTNPVITRGMVDPGGRTDREPAVAGAEPTGEIRYLDHVDTAALRDRYRLHEGFDVDAIVPIDYASGGRTIHETVGSDAPFDYVVASHVIEHVPDLIAWLDDVRSVLTTDGALTLAVPDHRRCFDVLRTPTVLADAVEAHLLRATVPSPRQVFDHHASARSWRGTIAWDVDAPLAGLSPVHPESEAWERASAAAAGHYDDVHCWVFTPRSFVELFAGLQRLALVGFDVETCSDTFGGEFFVTLRAADPAYATVTDEAIRPRHVPETAELREQLAERQHDLAETQAELDSTIASRSWRLTAPIRSLNATASRVRTRIRR